MKTTQIDIDVIKAYQQDKLWQQDTYYYALLEQAIRQPDLPREWRHAISVWGLARRQLTLNKAFQENGEVTIIAKKEALWRRLLRAAIAKIK